APRRERLRLLLATGALGGFTTYSGIAVEVWAGFAEGRWVGAAAYGLGTVLAGLAACAAGVVAGSRRRGGAAGCSSWRSRAGWGRRGATASAPACPPG